MMLMVVARGQQALLADARAILGERARVVEDRRRDGVLLPRAWRHGHVVPRQPPGPRPAAS